MKRNKKVLVQIPCFNEQENIDQVIQSIPRNYGNINITTLLIDDCSTDATIEKAIVAGVDIVVGKRRRCGLAHSFKVGQAYFLNGQFDYLVNTDGDNQYFQEHIPQLINKLELEVADIVIADRNTTSLEHFHTIKKFLQKFGSSIVSIASKSKICDAASGFRIYTRNVMANIFITSEFSYTMESLIQAGNKNFKIVCFKSSAKKVNRKSKLYSNPLIYVLESVKSIFKSVLIYRPIFHFLSFAILLMLLGSIPLIRYLLLLKYGSAGQHIQSLILGSIFMTSAFVAVAIGVGAELSRMNRQLIENNIASIRLSNKIDENLLLNQFEANIIYKK